MSNGSKYRPQLLGLTMRMLSQANIADTHDAVSQDWGCFLAAAGFAWLPIPNRGEESVLLAHRLGCTGFIFTGGGDPGSSSVRDVTEERLLVYARTRALPILGICRGFQALQHMLGGELTPVTGHIATYHTVHPDTETALFGPARMVNSYHSSAIQHAAQGLIPLAHSRDAAGVMHVEAAYGKRLLGLMWHPEREAVPHMADIVLLHRLFRGGNFHKKI